MSKEQPAKDAASSPGSVQLHSLREDYRRHTLSKADVAESPFVQFKNWMAEACNAEVPEPNAMTLATVGPSGAPSTRTVLLKGLERERFIFFTNYCSRKGRELEENPQASVTFLWKELERQVSIRGTVKKSSREASKRYFHSRPYGSQIGAITSTQSTVVESRNSLEIKYKELMEKYPEGGNPVPLPDNWGGFELIPSEIEFWQGRSSRLHDRILYSLTVNNLWVIERLCP
ncbi:MAG: pyridoxamine 5'-phosphate oxidase [Verrucomicrobiae bacterium]|nr:pyridoxamine 5'-phosphate oxidase [Verrucomicrobiae bacterium]